MFDLVNREGEVMTVRAVPFPTATRCAGEPCPVRMRRSVRQGCRRQLPTITSVVLCRADQASGSSYPIVGSGHLTTVGGVASESVREIYIGTLDAFPGSFFRPLIILFWAICIGYRRSGMPRVFAIRALIPMSFDEVGQQKVL